MRSSLPQHSDNILAGTLGEDYQMHFSSIYDYIPLVKPDALIVAYGSLSVFSDTPHKQLLLEYFGSIPCLMLEDISERSDIPSLVADNYVGMCQCIRHLIVDHGYRKIAFLSGPENNRDSAERLQAYRDTMQQYNLPITDTMIAYGNYTEMVTDKVEYLLDNNPWLEAIAFANDNMAKAGYAVCNKRGIVVGRDLAITGFDDVDIAKTMNPPLTSITHSSFLFSYQALQNAIRLCRGEDAFNGVVSFLPGKGTHFYTSFVLFSDEKQYGLLLCECEPDQIPYLLTCSIQIGAFLNLYQVNESERKIKEELQASLAAPIPFWHVLVGMNSQPLFFLMI